MKHWELYPDGEWDDEKNEPGQPSGNRITLSQDERVVSVEIADDGRFMISEECDTYFGADYDKAQMLELIDELRAWVESK